MTARNWRALFGKLCDTISIRQILNCFCSDTYPYTIIVALRLVVRLITQYPGLEVWFKSFEIIRSLHRLANSHPQGVIAADLHETISQLAQQALACIEGVGASDGAILPSERGAFLRACFRFFTSGLFRVLHPTLRCRVEELLDDQRALIPSLRYVCRNGLGSGEPKADCKRRHHPPSVHIRTWESVISMCIDYPLLPRRSFGEKVIQLLDDEADLSDAAPKPLHEPMVTIQYLKDKARLCMAYNGCNVPSKTLLYTHPYNLPGALLHSVFQEILGLDA